MPIDELTDHELVQRCAACEAPHRVAFDILEVGLARDGGADPSVIALPACARCRATEYLFRSPDNERPTSAPGSFGHLHRLLVDHLHADLVGRGRVIAALRDADGRPRAALARDVDPAELATWFPAGLRPGVPPR